MTQFTVSERDLSDLDPRFTPYFESGERVEVELKDGGFYVGYGFLTEGKKLRFYVGRSIGIKPIYLMLLKKNSMGGMAIPSDVMSIRGLGTYMHGRRV